MRSVLSQAASRISRLRIRPSVPELLQGTCWKSGTHGADAKRHASGPPPPSETNQALSNLSKFAEAEGGRLSRAAEKVQTAEERGLPTHMLESMEDIEIKKEALKMLHSVLAEANEAMNPVDNNAKYGHLPTDIDHFFAHLGLPEELKSYNKALHACAVKGDYEKGMEAYRTLQERGFTPDVYTFNSLIKLQTAAGNGPNAVDQAFRIWEDMSDVAIVPSVHSYGALINVCAKSGDLKSMYRVLDIMKENKVAPTPHISSTVLTGLLEKGTSHLDELWDRYYDFCVEGALPDSVTYSVLFRACALRKEVERGLALFMDMKMNGIDLTTRNANTIIYLCAYKPEFYAKGFEIFQELVDSGLRPDGHTLSSLLLCCAKNGDVANAMRVSKQFIASYNVQLNAKNYELLFESIAVSQKEEKLQLENGKADRKDRIRLAEAILQDMEKYRVRPTTRVLNKFLRVHTCAMEEDRAVKIFENIYTHYKVERDYHSYLVMLTMYCEVIGEDHKLEDFQATMKEHGHSLEIMGYIEVLKRYKRQEHWENTLETLEEMRQRDVRIPNYWRRQGEYIVDSILEARESKRHNEALEELKQRDTLSLNYPRSTER